MSKKYLMYQATIVATMFTQPIQEGIVDCTILGWEYQHLGKFATEQEAHEAWKKAKHARALVLAETLTDERAKQALRTRYLYG